ncbi:MAG: CBS domain-containing protein [Lishizhenia sp.]
MKISASIYSDKQRDLKAVIADLVAHNVDLLHVDCNDDLSVFDDIQKIRTWCNLPIDLHIITEKPENYFDLLRETPVEYVTFQYEQLPKGFELPIDIKGEKGLAVITPTSIDVFDAFNTWDFLLVMATIPGQSGGVFDPVNFKKVREFKKKYPKKTVHVDGGVNAEVSFILRNMGVRASVSGSYLFKSASIGEALMNLTNRAHNSQYLVRDFMHSLTDSICVGTEKLNLKTVLEAIEYGKMGFCIVVDETNSFKGIISNADVRKTMLKNIDSLENPDLSNLINENPVKIIEDASVQDLLSLVKQQAFPILYLPVVDMNNKATGIVTFVNLIKGEL